MKLKQYALIFASSFLTLLSTSSLAGREGISYYYGLGVGAAAPADIEFSVLNTNFDFEFDPTGLLEVVLGIEEDGWALEAIAGKSVDAGTNIDSLDYNLETMEIGLGYRSIEKNDRYYKFKYSKTDVDIEFDASGTTATAETEGDSITIGMGFRMDREEKMEIDYTYHDNDDTEEAIHFINVRYLWGGAKYHGKAH